MVDFFCLDLDSWSNPVGLESGHVLDSQISANDYLTMHTGAQHAHGPWKARLNRPFTPTDISAWATSHLSISDAFWQIDLLMIHEVTAITIQGRSDYNQYITSFEISLSNNTFSWTFLKQSDGTTNKVRI